MSAYKTNKKQRLILSKRYVWVNSSLYICEHWATFFVREICQRPLITVCIYELHKWCERQQVTVNVYYKRSVVVRGCPYICYLPRVVPCRAMWRHVQCYVDQREGPYYTWWRHGLDVQLESLRKQGRAGWGRGRWGVHQSNNYYSRLLYCVFAIYYLSFFKVNCCSKKYYNILLCWLVLIPKCTHKLSQIVSPWAFSQHWSVRCGVLTELIV